VTVNFPSGVMSPSATPSFRQVDSISASAPASAHERFVQTSMCVFPKGRKRYIA
jgi:hypothetical protein